jgi:hypothetical protein
MLRVRETDTMEMIEGSWHPKSWLKSEVRGEIWAKIKEDYWVKDALDWILLRDNRDMNSDEKAEFRKKLEKAQLDGLGFSDEWDHIDDFKGLDAKAFIDGESSGMGRDIAENVQDWTLPKETWSEIQEKMDVMTAELKEVFEEQTCMFSWNKYGVPQELRDILMWCIPWYDRETDVVEFKDGNVIFYNVWWIKSWDMKLYTFYDYFDKDVEPGMNTELIK